MPVVTAIFAGARFFLGTKIGRILLVVFIVAAAFGIWTWRVYEHGYANANAKIEEATAKESTRRDGVLEREHAASERDGALIKKVEDGNAALIQEFTRRLPAPGTDTRVCLDTDDYSRLRAASGRPAGVGIGKPAR